jgi:hypothetical protein
MSEADWLASENTAAMMIFLGKRLSHRKRELFFCGVLRLFWEYLSDDSYRRYCEVKERFLDGRATKKEMEEANQATSDKTAWTPAFSELDDVAKRETALLRHISGNPFSPCTVTVSSPSTVMKLAEALYDGQDCSFELYNALLEAGHPNLPEHFKDEQWHPKGCWALDLIIGRE